MMRLSHSSEVGPVDKILSVDDLGLTASALMGSLGTVGFDMCYQTW